MEKAALVVFAIFLGIAVLSLFATGTFRIIDGSFLTGAGQFALGALVGFGGTKFLRNQWPS